MPRAVSELDGSPLDELVWTDPTSESDAPEPSHVALQPVDAEEYAVMVECAIAVELDALHRAHWRRSLES